MAYRRRLLEEGQELGSSDPLKAANVERDSANEKA
jgi:hypothetical protein